MNILSLEKLVTQRIALLMFIQNLGILPQPIDTLFIINNSQHNYNTRQSSDLHTQIGKS